MTENMGEQLAVLIQLQALETRSLKIQTVLGTVDSKIAELDARLSALARGVESKEGELNGLLDRQKLLEQEIQTCDARIEKSDVSLRLVTTNKEYQTLLREIDDNRKRKSAMEEELLVLMESTEGMEAEVKAARNRLAQSQSQVAAEKETILSDSVEDREDLEAIEVDKAQIAGRLKPKLKEWFERLSKSTGGIVVVPVAKGVCQGCFMSIPAQLSNELCRNDGLKTCPHCHRIIYRELPKETEAAAAAS
ncbi:MAG: nucleotide-binding protein [Deltaproteobacteria bacterium]|nr:MAG: nucleotide-binding protein [Deltaproteobacteria bacterium]